MPEAQDAPSDMWKLTWSDEFSGDALDATKWDCDLGSGFFNYEANQWISGWGNRRTAVLHAEPANVSVRQGLLRIRAIKESLHGCGFTSARIKSRKRDGTALFAQPYGRFEVRAKLPVGQGVWPAIWMLPQDEAYGGWAASGEIDILEARGQKPNEVLERFTTALAGRRTRNRARRSRFRTTVESTSFTPTPWSGSRA